MNNILKEIILIFLIGCNSPTNSYLFTSLNNKNEHIYNKIDNRQTANSTMVSNTNIIDGLFNNIKSSNISIYTNNKLFYKIKINLNNSQIKLDTKKGLLEILINEKTDLNNYNSLIYCHNNIFKKIEISKVDKKNKLTFKFDPKYPVLTYYDNLNNKILYVDIAKTVQPFSKTIVLDPGHGGKDFGAINKDTKEKDIVLDIAKKMEYKLKEAGINVVYTRKDDTFIKLGERPNIANKIDSDLFVSIHINSNEKSYPEGIATYYYCPYDYQKKERLLLAKTIQNELSKDFPKWKNNGILSDRLKVLRCSKMPSILVEFGFISNEYDREKMSKPIIREKAATSITNGIIKYLNINKENKK